MTQHIKNFLLDCTIVTADGSLSTLDEFEGLYVYWCSLRAEAPLATPLLLDTLALDGVAQLTQDGVDYLEGLVLRGPVMADFIMSCEFTGAWGHAEPIELGALQQVVSA